MLEYYSIEGVDKWAYCGYLSLFFLVYFLLVRMLIMQRRMVHLHAPLLHATPHHASTAKNGRTAAELCGRMLCLWLHICKDGLGYTCISAVLLARCDG